MANNNDIVDEDKLFDIITRNYVNEDLTIEELIDDVYNKYFENIFTETTTTTPTTTKETKNSNLNSNSMNCGNLQMSALHDDAHNEKLLPTDDDFWIFGYGSLVWKADFPYLDRRNGYICGYLRRFYQHSLDHRGTKIKPGRVVTLTHTGIETDRVYGVAYRISAKVKSQVLDHLDYREKNGYERCTIKFYEFPENEKQSFDIIMYVATKDNDSYAGDVWQLPLIAAQIFTSAGPSGTNREYLFNLANEMRQLFPTVQDDHLFELENEVRKRIANDEAVILKQSLRNELHKILDKYITKNKNINEISIRADVLQIQKLRENCKKIGWKEFLLAKELKL